MLFTKKIVCPMLVAPVKVMNAASTMSKRGGVHAMSLIGITPVFKKDWALCK